MFIFSLWLSFLSQTNGDIVDGYGTINNSSPYDRASEIGEMTPCSEEPGVKGECHGSVKKWTYMKEWGCFYFQWSGCGGNRNNFHTNEACMRRCQNAKGGTIVFSLPGEMELRQNTLLTTLQTLGKEYSIAFELIVSRFTRRNLRNVIGLIRKEGRFKGLLYVSVIPKNKKRRGVLDIRIVSNESGKNTVMFTTGSVLKKNRWTSLQISQTLMDNKYMIEIKINDKRVHSAQMPEPSTFHNVDVFASSIYDPVDGKIRDIVIKNGIGQPVCCGMKKPGTRRRIFGGTETNANEYPWMVALKLPDNHRSFCGGSLVASQWVITAAHCLKWNKKNRTCIKENPIMPLQTDECKKNRGRCKWECNCQPKYNNIIPGICSRNAVCCTLRYKMPQDFLVVIGWHKQSEPSVLTREISISKVIPHDQYSGFITKNDDIGLLKLTEHVDLNIYTPVCLPMKGLSFAGRIGHIYGWGRTMHGGKPSDVLLETTQRILSDNECQEWVQYDVTAGGWLCGYNDGGKRHFSHGDSGGPTTVEDDQTKRHTLVGVISHGRKVSTEAGHPSFNANVSSYRDWLDDKMEGATFCPVM